MIARYLQNTHEADIVLAPTPQDIARVEVKRKWPRTCCELWMSRLRTIARRDEPRVPHFSPRITVPDFSLHAAWR